MGVFALDDGNHSTKERGHTRNVIGLWRNIVVSSASLHAKAEAAMQISGIAKNHEVAISTIDISCCEVTGSSDYFV